MRIPTQVATDVVLISPPLAVTTASIFGFSWSNFSYMLTSIYVGLLISHHAWKYWIKPLLGSCGDA